MSSNTDTADEGRGARERQGGGENARPIRRTRDTHPGGGGRSQLKHLCGELPDDEKRRKRQQRQHQSTCSTSSDNWNGHGAAAVTGL